MKSHFLKLKKSSQMAKLVKKAVTPKPKKNKYNYFKVIQQNYGQGWEDVSEYEADSQGNAKDRKLLQHDLKEYKLQHRNTRVIFRKQENK